MMVKKIYTLSKKVVRKSINRIGNTCFKIWYIGKVKYQKSSRHDGRYISLESSVHKIGGKRNIVQLLDLHFMIL